MIDFFDELPPSLLVDIICTMMIVWRIRERIVRTVLFCVVYDSCAQWYVHTYEQFLKMSAGLGLSLFLCICLGLAVLCVFLVQLGLFCCCVICFCCVRFSFFSTTPRDWLCRTSPKWPILCRVGCKTLTRSVNLWWTRPCMSHGSKLRPSSFAGPTSYKATKPLFSF